MNKEAKIGLTIILVLMGIFISTVAWRLYRSRAAEQASAVGDKDVERSEAAAKAEKDLLSASGNANSSAGQPKVITASTTSVKTPQSAASNEDLWNMTSDAGRKKISAGSGSELKRKPSYMPEPPKGDAEDRYDRYKNADRMASEQPRQQGRQGDMFGGSGRADTADYRNDLRRRRARAPGASGRRTYTVAEGDSLFDIARTELGKASRWVEIYDLNADVLGKDIDSLTPGTQIILPDDNAQQADPLTRHSTVEYRK
jgi:nucleoid-associated protein YgaU